MNKLLIKVNKKLARKSFRYQVSLLFILGIAIIVFIASIAINTLTTQIITKDYIKQGEIITHVLANKSAIALLYGSKESAQDAVDSILSFPNVKQVVILEANLKPLYQFGDIREWQGVIKTEVSPNPVLEFEDNKFWQFTAPVIIKTGNSGDTPNTPFEENANSQIVGYVKVLLSKEDLHDINSYLTYANTAIIILIASILFLIMQQLIKRMTAPLQIFAETMHSAEKGKKGIRLNLEGSQEILQMSNDFNKMMTVLEDHESELEVARDKAVESARIKSEFVANITHELRTPMNGIMGMLNLLKDMNLSKEQYEYANFARESGELLLLLITDVLDFSKLSAGKLALEQVSFNLREIIEGVMFLHASTERGNGIEVNYLYDRKLPLIIKSDQTRVRQILNNLVGNAVKFTNYGHVTLHAKLISEDDKNITIQFHVEDTGIGIDKSDIGKIFDSYSQRDNSTNRPYGGAGLGLAICKELIQLLNGKIWVESEAGKGSQFFVEIPFLKARQNDEEVDIVENLDAPKEAHARALVICPPGNFLTIMEDLCQEYQIELEWISEGRRIQEALQKSLQENNPFDMFMVNWPNTISNIMPLIAKMKQQPAFAQIKVIQFIQQQLINSDERHPIVDYFITKPIKQGNIVEILIKILKHKIPQGFIKPKIIKLSKKTREKKILVVEDNEVNQRVVLATLKKFGLNADVAINGEVAIESCKQNHYDLILMDCQMPILDGYDATRKIRELESTVEGKHTPIVALTANASKDDRDRCFASGMDDFIAKPFKIDRMSNILNEWLNVEST